MTIETTLKLRKRMLKLLKGESNFGDNMKNLKMNNGDH